MDEIKVYLEHALDFLAEGDIYEAGAYIQDALAAIERMKRKASETEKF